MWHGLHLCCCPLVLFLDMCCTLATCCVPHACPLPSTLWPLPHVTGIVWSCWVLHSFFVLDIWCGVVAWIALVLLISCAICRHVLHFGNLLHASCMHSALHCLASASCHLHFVVLFGFTFLSSQTSGVVLWHGMNFCCCPFVLSVDLCSTLATFCVPHACPLPSPLWPLPHVTGIVWSCWVLLSSCLRHLVWLCGMGCTCVAALLCYL